MYMMNVKSIFSVLVPICMLPVSPVAAQQAEDEEALQSNPETDRYDIAESLYLQARQGGLDDQSRRMGLASAAELFGRFVKDFPNSPNAIKAQYRQAICLEESGNRAAADAVLEKVAGRQNGGEFAAAAAYKLATQAAGRNLWETARNYYLITARESQNDNLRNDANFRLARAHQQLGQKKEAEELFAALVDTPGISESLGNMSLFALAQMKTEDAQYDKAYSCFTRLLAKKNVDQGIRATATLQAARLASKLGKTAEAGVYYSEILRMPGMEKYAGEAQMDKLLSLYREKNYPAVVQAVSGKYAVLDDPEKESRRALIVGQSYMELKEFENAARWFEVAELAVPKTAFAADAAYRRLICLQQLRNPNFMIHAQKFLAAYAVAGQSTAALPCVDLVRLMYANKLLLSNAQEASRQLEAINYDNLSSLPESSRAEIMYKRAWCASKNDNGALLALEVLNSYIKTYPNDVHMADALALRGTCYMRENNLTAAMADFEKVVKEYPTSASAPLSMQKAAQVANERKDVATMIHYYELLINTKNVAIKPSALAEAHYQIARAKAERAPAEAIPHFEAARSINPNSYTASVDLCLVQCYFRLEDAEKLRDALKTLERNNVETYRALPPDIPLWCGWKCFQNKKYLDAEKYLSDAVGRSPRETYKDAEGKPRERAAVQPLVWKTLARTRLELRQFESGLEAAEHYVSMEQQPYRKAEGMRDKAQLLIGLRRTAEARKLCEDAIAMGIDGPIKSSTFLTLGDSYFAERNFAEAAKYYGRTANVVSDAELKPLGLYKVAYALRSCERAGEAAHYEEALKKEFPNWLADPNTAIFMKMHEQK